jgi:hypothetical protein
VIHRALARNRDERFMTALAFQMALATALPPAPSREVAALLQRVCAADLEKRRRTLAEALGGAERLARTLPESAPPALLSSTVRERRPEKLTPAEGDTRIAATSDVTTPGLPRTRAWRYVALAALVGLGAAARLVLWPRAHAPPASGPTDSGTPSVTTTQIPTLPPTPAPSATPTPSATPANAAKDAGTPRGVSTGKRHGPGRGKPDDLRHDFDPGGR